MKSEGCEPIGRRCASVNRGGRDGVLLRLWMCGVCGAAVVERALVASGRERFAEEAHWGRAVLSFGEDVHRMCGVGAASGCAGMFLSGA